MPRGRHRHSPPLHRLLPPTAIAGVSLVCALGPWVFSEQSVLRVTAAVAAATAAVGAAVMRRWDVEAGKRVADLTRARAGDEWRHEERAAELETDLDESRELRTKLEHKLRAKRAELADLRNEHAALLRRYATAETERASALEGRRLLEIEATVPEGTTALAVAGSDADAGTDTSVDADAGTGADAGTDVGTGDGAEAGAAAQASPVPPQGVPAPGAPWAPWEAASEPAAKAASTGASTGVPKTAKGGAVAASAGAEADAAAAGGDAKGEADEEVSGAKRLTPAVFSPAGSSLFLRANSALDRMITQRGSVKGSGEGGVEVEVEVEAESDAEAEAGTGAEADTRTDAVAADGNADAGPDAQSTVAGAGAGAGEESASEAKGDSVDVSVADSVDAPAAVPAADSVDAPVADAAAKGQASQGGSPKGPSPQGDPDGPTDGGTRQGRASEAEEEPVPVLIAEEDDAVGKSVAAGGHERAAAEPMPAVPVPARSTRSARLEETASVELSARVQRREQAEHAEKEALPAVRSAAHFTVPTAVAVVPATPQRRTAVEGGFDFFGTQKGTDTLEAVQNEDLADVVGQEALALHKAESEARFKRADETSRGVGQVIDLTAHDETEQIDVQGLRTAAF